MLVNSTKFIHVRDSSYTITTIMKNVVPMSEIRGWSINLIHCHSYIVFTAYRGPQHKNVKPFAQRWPKALFISFHFLTTLNTCLKLLNPAINISQFDSVVRIGHIGLFIHMYWHQTHTRRFNIDTVAALI